MTCMTVRVVVGLGVVSVILSGCGGGRRAVPQTTPSRPAASETSTNTTCPTGHERLAGREYEAAAEAFDRCAEANPTDAYSYYYAGMAYREVGRVDLMVSRFQRFVELAPDAPERPRVQAMLRAVSR